jgi:HPt (histidine-containing phosphotransfer) domain-containing protein
MTGCSASADPGPPRGKPAANACLQTPAVPLPELKFECRKHGRASRRYATRDRRTVIEAGKTMFETTVAPAQTTFDGVPAREPGAYDALVREIGEDGACEVRDVFWSETCARLKLFRTLSPAQNHARIAREAHSLKSAAGTFGYLRLAALALRLEKTAEELGDAESRDLLDLMDAAYAAARAQEPQG